MLRKKESDYSLLVLIFLVLILFLLPFLPYNRKEPPQKKDDYSLAFQNESYLESKGRIYTEKGVWIFFPNKVKE